VKLVPLQLRLQRRPGPLLAQIMAVLGDRGRPLRWAITAVDSHGLLVEAVVLV
jgi:hypothetical protein